MGTITYFAYGSNMSLKRLKKRVCSAKATERGVLRCHRLAFHKVSTDRSGKCDIPSATDSDVVWGRLYQIDDREKERLDCAEGRRHGYEDKCVTVEFGFWYHCPCLDLLCYEERLYTKTLYLVYKAHFDRRKGSMPAPRLHQEDRRS